MRTGDTVEGVIRAPGETERYFALTKVTAINFEDPEKARHKVAFDNLTPLYPDERGTFVKILTWGLNMPWKEEVHFCTC